MYIKRIGVKNKVDIAVIVTYLLCGLPETLVYLMITDYIKGIL